MNGFSESIKHRVENGMNGSNLVNEVLEEWERIVNRVAKTEVGEKMIVCGRAARWWDDEIRAKIGHRRQVYRLIVSGEEELWEEYYRLRKEVKQLVVEEKLNIWNEVANSDFEGNRKEFWAFVGRRRKGGISVLRNDAGVSVSSTKGKLQSHYERLGSSSVEAAFDDVWGEEVENIVRDCIELSVY